MTIRTMAIEDYDAVHALWESLPGLGLHEYEDSRAGIGCYLRRNPGTCFVALEQHAIIGAVLCGNDGRRGYINHLAVARECQGRGVGRALVAACAAALRAEHIPKAAILVYRNNGPGNAFWDALGFDRDESLVYRTLGL